MTWAPKGPLKRRYSHDQANKPFIEAGAEVVCPNPFCKKTIARFVKPLRQGEVITSMHLVGDGISYGAEMKCQSCGIPWFLPETTQIHLRSGWIPRY
jgi:hypothetical protein